MGLHIVYYQNAVPVSSTQNDIVITENWETTKYLQPYIHPEFPDHAHPIKYGRLYTAEMIGNFRAGSYIGYYEWRKLLATMVGSENPDNHSFSELINFADNEGIIGSTFAAKLAKDFAEYRIVANNFAAKLKNEDQSWFIEKYIEWKVAFEVAAKNGYVEFG